LVASTMSEEDKEPQPVVVQAVAVVTVVDEEEKEFERDSSDDNCFDKFVVCIVRTPMVIIGVTMFVSFVIGMITIAAINSAGSEVFASGKIGNEDRDDVRTVSFDAAKEAKASAWPVVRRPLPARV
jgi:hypothetical protein